MTQAVEIAPPPCPSCFGPLYPPAEGGRTICPRCRWAGEVYVFKRLPVDITAAESALPQDATCIHHPTKKATVICAGTGDYICSLCAIEVKGETYSAEYLNKGGKGKLTQAFDRYLVRPDSKAYTLVISILIPYVDLVTIALVFLWVPYGFVLYFRALRLRRENELFRRVMPKSRLVTIPIYLGLIGVGWLIGAGSLLYLLMRRESLGR